VIILLEVKILKDTQINWTYLELPLYEKFLLERTSTTDPVIWDKNVVCRKFN
jgi:hypothetical protein